MPAARTQLSDEFIVQQRTRLDAVLRELRGGRDNTIADDGHLTKNPATRPKKREDDAQGSAQDDVNQSLRNVSDQRIGRYRASAPERRRRDVWASRRKGRPHTQGPARGRAGGHLYGRRAGPPRSGQVSAC